MAKRSPIKPQMRFSVLSRDRFTCRYCSRSAPEVELEVDHVVAHSKGGPDEIENLVTACVECNAGKSDKDVDFVPEAASQRSRRMIHPLVGSGLLTFRDGKLYEQGLIVAVVDTPQPAALIQYFEWMMGSETYQRLILLSDIVFDASSGDTARVTYRLFPSNDDRNQYYEWKNGKFAEGVR